jgi:Anti-sigma factor NepR
MEFALSQSDRPGRHRRKPGAGPPARPDSSPPPGKEPGWADGLRQLYNSVVDEPLPDSFDDLLKKLDQQDHGRH